MKFFTSFWVSPSSEQKPAESEIMKQPYTPVKKAVLKAMFDYLTKNTEEYQKIQGAVTQQLKLSDNLFILKVREFVSSYAETSSFRVKLAPILTQAESELGLRRSHLQNLMATVSVCALISGPGLILGGISAATLLAYHKNLLSLLSDELLEIYDSTKIAPVDAENKGKTSCERLSTTYYGFSR